MKRKLISIILTLALTANLWVPSAAAQEIRSASQDVEEELSLGDKLYQDGSFSGVDEDSIVNSDKEPDKARVEGAITELAAEAEALTGDCIDLSEYGLTVDETEDILAELINDNPQYFYINGAEITSDAQTGLVEGMVLGTEADTAEKKATYEAAVAAALKGVEDNWSDVEKLLYLHDYLVTHCQYDIDGLNGVTPIKTSAYDAMVDGLAVCNGYALAYKDLCTRAGIETYFVSSAGLSHAWNLVMVNGKGYYVDCTWDDPCPELSNHMFRYYSRHDNFLRSQDGMTSTDHTSTDWRNNQSTESESFYGLYNNTEYDSAGILSAEFSPAVYVFDGFLYLNANDGKVYKHDRLTGTETALVTVGSGAYWPVWGKSGYHYNNTYGTMTQAGDLIFVNDDTKIYKLNPDTGELSELYSLSDSEKALGYIYGISVQGDSLNYDIGTDYRDKDKTGSGSVDISSLFDNSLRDITLNKILLRFEAVGEKEKLTATLTPSDSTETVVWKSSDESVAVVDQSGNVTAKSYGSAVITATAGGRKDNCTVYVDTTWQEDYTYSVNEVAGKIILSKYTGSDADITVRAKAYMDGKLYSTEIAYGAFNGTSKTQPNTVLKNVVLEDGVCVQNPMNMFMYCTAIESYQAGKVVYKSGDCSNMFNGCTTLKSVDFGKAIEGSGGLSELYATFYGCSGLESVKLNGMDLSSVKTTEMCFYGCSSLTELDLSKFDFGNVTSCSWFINNLSNLSKLETPYNVKEGADVTLPRKMYDEDGTEYSILPEGTDSSITLYRVRPGISSSSSSSAKSSSTSSSEKDSSTSSSAKDSSTSSSAKDSSTSSSAKDSSTSSSEKDSNTSSSAKDSSTSSSAKSSSTSSSVKDSSTSNSAKDSSTSSSAKDSSTSSSAKDSSTSSSAKDSSTSSSAKDSSTSNSAKDSSTSSSAKSSSTSSSAKDSSTSSSVKDSSTSSSAKNDTTSSSEKESDASSSAKDSSTSSSTKGSANSQDTVEDQDKDSSSDSGADNRSRLSPSSNRAVYSEKNVEKKGEDGTEFIMDISLDNFVYDGTKKKPVIKIKDKSGHMLSEGTDYKVSYKNNKNASLSYDESTGTFKDRADGKKPTYIVKFKGSYKSAKSITGTFDIAPCSLSFVTIEPKKTDFQLPQGKSFKFLKRATLNVGGKAKKLNTSKDLDAQKTKIVCVSPGAAYGKEYDATGNASAPSGKYEIILKGTGNFYYTANGGTFTLTRT